MNGILSSNVRCALCSPLFEKWGHSLKTIHRDSPMPHNQDCSRFGQIQAGMINETALWTN